MKGIYLEAFSGISGNMLLGALLDAGYPIENLRSELKKLNIGDYELVYRRVNKLGIDAQYFNVLLPDEHKHHDEEHHHEHCHQHEHGEEHHHEELHHAHHHHEHRNLHDIMNIIDASDLSQNVKAKAREVFTAIAVAEAKVHGKPIEEVHFHEVGAIDTIIDIVGCLLGLEYLGIEKIYAGKITTGYGFVNCAHGLMPIPAPATAELLQSLPQQQGRIAKELTTPTGAALVKVLAQTVLEMPEDFIGEKIAYGAGTWELEVPNVLRVHIGEIEEAQDDVIVEASCNIDDMGGEVFAYTIEKLLLAGALDAWAEPVIMKKGRPAYKLVLLAEKGRLDDLLQIVFAETTTLGVRYHEVSRSVLERNFIEVELPQGAVTVKYAMLNGEVINIAPEYDSCKELALASGRSLKDILSNARAAAEVKLHE